MANPKIPGFVSKQYGGAKKFKAAKRWQIKEMTRLLRELRLGCSYFPSGASKPMKIGALLDELADECSAKKWGH